ncbi:MAG: LysE family translocator [Caulobacter sp.]|nr:LysE family translocator [Caulobacter sp.]
MILPVDPARYGAFLAIMAVMAVTPGPANLFAIAAGMQRGRGQALIGVAGMNAATLVWFGGAALGLGALVAAFPAAFRLLAVAGGLYVAWLGLRSIWAGLRGRADAEAEAAPVVHTARSAFLDGFSVQIANPKALLFFTAVLPPFIDTGRPIVPQLLLFAVATIGFDIIAMSAYGLGGATLSTRMNEPAFRRGFALLVGALLIAAAGLILTRD